MGGRAWLLVMVIGVAVVVAACGRAGEAEINQALGITPTATASAAQMATGAAVAMASATARAAAAVAASSPGGAAVAALGDVARGTRQFTTQCAGCHRVGGRGPDILSAGSAGGDVTAETLLPLIRKGTGHAVPPGPYATTQLSDAAIVDIAAYIWSRAAP